MNILVIEDEILAKEKLFGFIANELPKAEIIGWARSVKEAKELLRKEQNIDLIFSDIKLMGGTAFNVFNEVEVTCPIIFCSAYDQYLINAFQANGIAYLLKPYTEESFGQAVKKFRTLFKKEEQLQISKSTFKDLVDIVEGQTKRYKSRFAVKKNSGIKLLNVADIVIFEANGSFCLAVDNQKKKNVLNSTLSEIEASLDPTKFFRINRSEIINIDFIDSIEPYFKNRLVIKLKHRPEACHTSSAKTAEFRLWLEG